MTLGCVSDFGVDVYLWHMNDLRFQSKNKNSLDLSHLSVSPHYKSTFGKRGIFHARGPIKEAAQSKIRITLPGLTDEFMVDPQYLFTIFYSFWSPKFGLRYDQQSINPKKKLIVIILAELFKTTSKTRHWRLSW